MKLESVRFLDSVTHNGRETERLQSTDAADPLTYADVIQLDGDVVRWGALDWAPLSNVRQSRKAPETMAERILTTKYEEPVTVPAKGKKR